MAALRSPCPSPCARPPALRLAHSGAGGREPRGSRTRGGGGASPRPRPIGGRLPGPPGGRDVEKRGANRGAADAVEGGGEQRCGDTCTGVCVNALSGAGARSDSRRKMPANVEIKARVQDLARLISRVERLSGSPGQVLLQTDTFFPVPRGRLKLRDLRDGHGQLVFYDRPNSRGPKLSHFTISPTDDPRGLAAVLSQALGEQGVVKKERHLYMVGQTRVHVDHVEGLGDFVELENAAGKHCLPCCHVISQTARPCLEVINMVGEKSCERNR
ncbi:uncharacterized protein PHA67_023622 isoform 2-T2 [Liasis olivaceus]